LIKKWLGGRKSTFGSIRYGFQHPSRHRYLFRHRPQNPVSHPSGLSRSSGIGYLSPWWVVRFLWRSGDTLPELSCYPPTQIQMSLWVGDFCEIKENGHSLKTVASLRRSCCWMAR